MRNEKESRKELTKQWGLNDLRGCPRVELVEEKVNTAFLSTKTSPLMILKTQVRSTKLRRNERESKFRPEDIWVTLWRREKLSLIKRIANR